MRMKRKSMSFRFILNSLIRCKPFLLKFMSVKICIYSFFLSIFPFANKTNHTCDEPDCSRTPVILAWIAKYLHWKFASLCHFKFAILCTQFLPTYLLFHRFAVQTRCTLYCTLQRTNTENWKQIFPEKELRMFCLLCCRKYVDRSWE